MLSTAPAFAQAPLALEGSAARSPWQRYPGWNKTNWDSYNTLANPKATPPKGSEIIVEKVTGDPAKGQQLAFDRNRGGGCLACHVMGPRTLETPGNVGPDLSEIGNAGRTDQWLFNYVFDARVYNPKSVMPPWGKHGFYTEAEIRDMVAFLKTLKTPAKFANPLDDPEKRPMPVEDRDALDPFVNPAAERIEAGAALFKQCLRLLPRHAGDQLQALGGRDAQVGAAAQEGARRRGVRHPPRQGDRRQGLADAIAREHRHVGLPA